MNKLIYIFVLMSLYFPVHAWDWGESLIPCKPSMGVNGVWEKKCGFNDLIKGGENIIDFLIKLSIPVSVLLFAYAGILYIRDREKANTQAKKIFWNIIVGLFFMLAAFLIVKAILSGLGATPSANEFLK